jgi:hypothetical protein
MLKVIIAAPSMLRDVARNLPALAAAASPIRRPRAFVVVYPS